MNEDDFEYEEEPAYLKSKQGSQSGIHDKEYKTSFVFLPPDLSKNSSECEAIHPIPPAGGSWHLKASCFGEGILFFMWERPKQPRIVKRNSGRKPFFDGNQSWPDNSDKY